MAKSSDKRGVVKGYITACDGTRLYYEECGKGQPLVLCTGIAVSFLNWKYLFEDLSKHYRVIQWDYRGHGMSEKPADYANTKIENLADDLERVRAYFGFEKFALLGHSMGVQVIFEYYRHHPKRVNALIAAFGTYEGPFNHLFRFPPIQLLYPVMYWLGTNDSLLMKGPWNLMGSNPLGFLTEVMRYLGVVHHRLCKPEDFSSYFEHYADLDMRTFFEIGRAAQSHSVKDVLPQVKVPTLVIGGAQDILTPPRFSRRMAFAIPGSEYLEIPEGTHTALIEQPEIIDTHIRSFLDRSIG